jgi:CheY-like chemotaxis protein
MEGRPRILLVDDEPELLELYREILAHLPSKPEIRTARSGAKALALLEAEPYRLLICDLKMPKMDGLQVLSIVRRKYPQLRTAVLTSVMDEEFRSRAYAIGVDLFWHKPGTNEEIKLFLDCLESLLGGEPETGFRGVQNKSLLDIIQVECLSQSSVVLRITNGPLNARVWINGGELVDAEAEGVRGEDAFAQILSWKAGSFELLPAEMGRARTIHKPYNVLLLETAQTLDEQRSESISPSEAESPPSGTYTAMNAVSQLLGVEFVLALSTDAARPSESRGLEDPEVTARWARQALARFGGLSDRLSAGPLQQIGAHGVRLHIGVAPAGEVALAIGWQSDLNVDDVAENMKKAVALWGT